MDINDLKYLTRWQKLRVKRDMAFASDVKAGMKNFELAAKYNLSYQSAKNLKLKLKKLQASEVCEF